MTTRSSMIFSILTSPLPCSQSFSIHDVGLSHERNFERATPSLETMVFHPFAGRKREDAFTLIHDKFHLDKTINLFYIFAVYKI